MFLKLHARIVGPGTWGCCGDSNGRCCVSVKSFLNISIAKYQLKFRVQGRKYTKIIL